MSRHLAIPGSTGLRRVRSLLSFRHQNPLARLISVVAAFAAAVVLVGANLSPAQAAQTCYLPGGFEIDGDMVAQNCAPTAGDDWSTHTISASDVASTSDGGTYKTANDDTSDPSNWTSSGSTPSKGDFGVAYSFAKIVNGHYIVYVAWERDGTSGTGGYVIEFDNSTPNTFTDGSGNVIPQPDRSLGGSTYYLSATGGAAPELSCKGVFADQSEYGPNLGCPAASITGFYSQVNTDGGITDSFSGLPVDKNGFYEVALDITELTKIPPGCPGPSAASLYIRSLTGEVKNGNLKGYLQPLSLKPDSTCVAPTITTQTQSNDPIDGLDVVAPGTLQHDVATITGTQAHPAPTGSVSFHLCGPTVGSPADCTTGGADGGTDNTLDQTATHSTAQSSDVAAPSTPGFYCWRAEFTPDPVTDDNPFTSAVATDKTNECFQVAHAHPSISTESSAVDTGSGAKPNSVGFTELGDTATLSDVVAGADLSQQKITFTLYGPLASPVGVDDCVAGAVATPSVDVLMEKVDSTTWTASAPTYTPTAAQGPGVYTWVASYAGDDINDKAAGTCGDLKESQELVGPKLTLSKGTPSSTITAGDDAVYDIFLLNEGAGTAANVVVTDVLPTLKSGATWTLDATSGYNCSIADGTGGDAGHQVVTCNVGNLDPSLKTQIAEVTATTTADDCGDLDNTAVLTADPNVNQPSDKITITVKCPGLDILKQADHVNPVDVGSPIGFTITASNTGTGTATGTLVRDVLPAGPGISWTIDPAATGPLACGIAAGIGGAGHQVLTCTGDLTAGGDPEIVHVVSQTQWTGSGATEVNSCLGGDGHGRYDNTATITASNSSTSPSSTDHEQVLCPALTFVKKADNASVTAGGQIGFTITATNGAGAGTAKGVVINDPLPAGSGVDWSVASGAGCSIQGAPPSESLHCDPVDLGPGTSETVHVVSATGNTSCATYPNVATLNASNVPGLSASATAQVAGCVIVSPPVQQHHPQVLPNTGGPDGWVFGAGLALVLAGGTLVLSDQRRKRRS